MEVEINKVADSSIAKMSGDAVADAARDGSRSLVGVEQGGIDTAESKAAGMVVNIATAATHLSAPGRQGRARSGSRVARA